MAKKNPTPGDRLPKFVCPTQSVDSRTCGSVQKCERCLPEVVPVRRSHPRTAVSAADARTNGRAFGVDVSLIDRSSLTLCDFLHRSGSAAKRKMDGQLLEPPGASFRLLISADSAETHLKGSSFMLGAKAVISYDALCITTFLGRMMISLRCDCTFQVTPLVL